MNFILFILSFFKDLLNLPNLTPYVHYHTSPKHKILYLSDEKIKIKVHNFFTTYRGVYNFVGPPPRPPHPQPRTHRAAAYRALAHGPQPREPCPMEPQPRELQPRELQPR